MFWSPAGTQKGSVESWVAAYNATLSFEDCRLLAWYNWSPQYPVTGPAMVAARQMLETWEPSVGRN